MRVLVVGGAGGVGGALVSSLLGRGDAVVATVRNAVEAAAVAQAYGGRVETVEVDLARLDQIEDRLRAAFEVAGEIDGVAVCAAYAPTGPLESTMSPPERVADAIVAALTEPEPATRYVVGSDAEQMIGAAGTMGDREIDAMFNRFFGID